MKKPIPTAALALMSKCHLVTLLIPIGGRSTFVVGLGALFSAVAVQAAPQTLTLDVPGMTCAACPITVKKAISKVDGVSKVDVSYEKRQAVVTFDDTKVSAHKLTQATANAGYPSTVKH